MTESQLNPLPVPRKLSSAERMPPSRSLRWLAPVAALVFVGSFIAASKPAQRVVLATVDSAVSIFRVPPAESASRPVLAAEPVTDGWRLSATANVAGFKNDFTMSSGSRAECIAMGESLRNAHMLASLYRCDAIGNSE